MTWLTAGLKALAGRIAIRTGFARLRRDRSGATTVEFALVALPFFGLLFAILETALMFFAGQTMDTAVTQAARMIRTGQAQAQGFNVSAFKAKICGQLTPLFNCTSGLKLDVRKYATFAAMDLTVPLDGAGNLNTNDTYIPGNGGDIVVVRAYYEWPVFVKLLGNNLKNMASGNHLLISTVAFRNEPFPW